MTTPWLLALSVACTDRAPIDTDSGGDSAGPVYSCEGGVDDPTASLGTGSGATFVPLEDGQQVTLEVAPQGGMGVAVRVITTGLQADAPVDVLLDTEIDGELSASFLNEAITLYCQDDGRGMLWGVNVGFSAEDYPTSDFSALFGQVADLVVTVTDQEGRSVTGRSTVEVVETLD